MTRGDRIRLELRRVADDRLGDKPLLGAAVSAVRATRHGSSAADCSSTPFRGSAAAVTPSHRKQQRAEPRVQRLFQPSWCLLAVGLVASTRPSRGCGPSPMRSPGAGWPEKESDRAEPSQATLEIGPKPSAVAGRLVASWARPGLFVRKRQAPGGACWNASERLTRGAFLL